MSEKKWAAAMSSISMILDLHNEQMEVIKHLVGILMDEEGQNAEETNESVLERIQRLIWERRTAQANSEEETPEH
jgi:hypothetical protein